MKTRLPKALLAALFALPCVAYAGGQNQTQVLQIVEKGKVYNIPNDTFLNKVYDNSTTATPKVWVKDGQGTALLSTDVDMYNPLVVREGTFEINGANVRNFTPLSDGNSNLAVGGNNAHLILDNASYTQKIGYAGQFTSAIAIGTTDGAGKVTLKNNSTLHTDQFIFAGYKSISNGYVTSTTVSQKDSSQYSNGIAGRSTISIESRSVLSAGTSLQFANVDVTVDGVASALRDNTRNLTNNQWPESYFGYSSESSTNIDVTGGATLDMNWDLYTSSSKDSSTIINIKGSGVNDNNEKVASSMTVAGTAHLSMVDDYDYTDSDTSNQGAYTELNIIEGAKADISQLVMGVDAGEAKVTIDSDSSYEGVTVRVGANGTLKNSGAMKLQTGVTTHWPTNGGALHSDCISETKSGTLTVEGGSVTNDGKLTVDAILMQGGELTNSGTIAGNIFMDGGVFTMEEGAVAAGLTATSGVINISGNVTFKGAVSLGGVVSESSVLMFSGANEPALTVYIEQGSVITMDTTSLTVDGQTFTVGEDTVFIVDLGDDLYSEDMQIFTLAGANAELLASATEAIAAKTTVTWTVGEDKQSVGFGTGTTLSDKNIGTTVVAVPEPTTATLSLLALCGLAMRRRRK